MHKKQIKKILEEALAKWHGPEFIAMDPVQIPHRFQRKEDIEIMGFFTAVLAWGQRATILKNAMHLAKLMDGAPYEFIISHDEKDLERCLGFVHRTFNDTDLLYFIASLKNIYLHHGGLEGAFTAGMKPSDRNVEHGLNHFHYLFFSLPEVPGRTRKHIAAPNKNSACKRLNMFLRWMVRSDHRRIDFGIWKQIKPAQLICPLDVHAATTARMLGLLPTDQNNWKAAVTLTENLKKFNEDDPVVYDYALYGEGILRKRH